MYSQRYLPPALYNDESRIAQHFMAAIHIIDTDTNDEDPLPEIFRGFQLIENLIDSMLIRDTGNEELQEQSRYLTTMQHRLTELMELERAEQELQQE